MMPKPSRRLVRSPWTEAGILDDKNRGCRGHGSSEGVRLAPAAIQARVRDPNLVLHIKINLGRGTIEQHLCSVELHIERIHVSPTDSAHGFCRLGYRILRSFGKTVLGCSYHFDNFLRHYKLL